MVCGLRLFDGEVVRAKCEPVALDRLHVEPDALGSEDAERHADRRCKHAGEERLEHERAHHLLALSHATAKTHVSRLLTKLGARDRAQLVLLAYESRVARPGGV